MFRRSGSIRLFRVFGIRVGVDPSWFLILFLMIYLLSGPFRDTLHSSDGVAYVTTVITVLLLFGSIVIHELGHALAARRLGVGVTQIDLYLFGGLTQMTRDPVTPGEDFTISAAGPAATLGVIVICLAVADVLLGGHRLYDAVALDTDIQITPVELAITWLIPVNILLLAFNLLPAFPLDGGRIARSIVWRATGDKRRGTVIAARLGQVLAVLLAALGLYLVGAVHSFGGLYTLVLAWMLYTAAKGALVQADFTERIDGVTVADIMDAEPVAIPDSIAVGQALEEYFWRYRYPWFPVIDAEHRFVGIVREVNVQAVADGGEGWLLIASLVESEGPAGWRVRADGLLSELLGSGSLGSLGAVMAVDRDGVLRGVVTTDRVRRAMSTVLEP
jgi:Zn-dependent protease